jgi:hypothetical protein
MSEETKTELPVKSPAIVDGFDDNTNANARLIQGTIITCVDGVWSAKDGTSLPPGARYTVLSTAEAIQRWEAQRPVETILKKPGKALPDVDELNAKATARTVRAPAHRLPARPEGRVGVHLYQ